MVWQSMDFSGGAVFTPLLQEQLQDFLAKKETTLSRLLAKALPISKDTSSPQLLQDNTSLKLPEGVEILAKRIDDAIISSNNNNLPWPKLTKKINDALWDFADLLQSISQELFRQLDLIELEKWNPSLLDMVGNIKAILFEHLDDLKWAVQRIENSLWDYRKTTKKKFFQWSSFPHWKRLIDPSLLKNLEKCQKYLQQNFDSFLRRYHKYMKLHDEIEKKMLKFHSYAVLHTLETSEQEGFKYLYKFLKFWRLNAQTKALPEKDLARAIRYKIYPDKASSIFKNYYLALQNKLFSQSRDLKQQTLQKLNLQEELSNQRFELHTLGATLSAYREFLLKTDPNPYISTRGGFPEWTIGLEPPENSSLIHQEYNVERLDDLLLEFSESSELSLVKERANKALIEASLKDILHEMSQPLISSSSMSYYTEQFVDRLNQLNELSSKDPQITTKMTFLFSKAMRIDWRTHQLHGIPLFHELYNVHIQILGLSNDPQHLSRMRHFKKLLQKLQQWIKSKNIFAHLHDIELDIHDTKIYLQDFLGHLQRLAKDKAQFTKESASQLIQEAERQLLEYRYLFGNFFHELHQTEIEDNLLRNQFLFVDQYFETIENKIMEMKLELET